MKSTRFIAALGFVLMAAPAFAQADKVVAKVDGIPITQQEVELATEDLGERLAQLPEDRKRDEVINYLVDLKLGAKAAAEAKAAQTPDFAARLAYYREQVLLDQYLTGLGQKAVIEEAAKKLYEHTTKAMTPDDEAHARHILV